MDSNRTPNPMFSLKNRGWLIGGLAAVVGVVGALAAVTVTRKPAVTVTLPPGTQIVGVLDHSISTERTKVGERIELKVNDPIEVGSGPPIPAGATMIGEVIQVKDGGRVAGAPELALAVRTLRINGDDHAVSTTPFRFKGKSDAKESALEIAGGAVAGAVLGKVIGDKPLPGAVIGAAAGTAVAVATDGDHIVLPGGTRLRARLVDPVTVSFRPSDNPAGSVERRRGSS